MKLADGAAKAAELDGARLPSPESLRRAFTAIVFTPDRLAVVKGGPAARRAYFDRVLGRLQPARAGLPQDYAAALAQRNAALRRVQLGLSDRVGARAVDGARGRDRRAARGGAAGGDRRRSRRASPRLPPSSACPTRRSATRASRRPPPRSRRASRPTCAAARPASARTSTTCASRRASATCGASARRASSASRCSRCCSRETELLSPSPLLLLDDVLSELDSRRRARARRARRGLEQVVITATQRSALPVEPAQVVEVTPGQAV